MESRISRLEIGFEDLNRSVRNLDAKMDKMSDSMSKLFTRIESNKPVSYQAVLTTAISVAVFFSMVVGGIFWLIDARVGNATLRANAFVESQIADGRLYVQLERITARLDRVESAIRWTPSIVATR